MLVVQTFLRIYSNLFFSLTSFSYYSDEMVCIIPYYSARNSVIDSFLKSKLKAHLICAAIILPSMMIVCKIREIIRTVSCCTVGLLSVLCTTNLHCAHSDEHFCG